MENIFVFVYALILNSFLLTSHLLKERYKQSIMKITLLIEIPALIVISFLALVLAQALSIPSDLSLLVDFTFLSHFLAGAVIPLLLYLAYYYFYGRK